MKLQGNGLLKVLVPLFLALALAIVVMWPGSDSDQQSAQQGSLDKKDPSLTLSQDELKALGIEGDTPEDTVATLVGQTRLMRDQMNRILDANDKLREQNQELAERNDNVDGRIRSALRDQQQDFTQERRQNQRENQSLLNNLQGQIRNLKEGFTGDADESGDDDMPIGLGLEGGGGPTGSYSAGGNLAWVEPMDQRQETGRNGSRGAEGPAFPTSFKAAASDVGDAASRANSAIKASATGQPDEATVEPVYTIPENSTLMGSLAMTALLGRVPVDGTVNDPYPFKVMIGKDNLTANGIELPEVRAAVASGTATGDWTLSCVRGNITSLTFVFEDGTIRTVPSPEDVNQGGGGNDNRSNQNQTIGGGDSIGWISDQAGLPCISGMRRSNAQQYLGTQGLLTAAGAGAATMLSDDDSTSITSFGSDGSISQAMSGNQAVGQILSQGVNDMSEWVNKLYGEAFAAVYVPPGQNVAIHINKQLPIDYETEGRKVRYDTSTATTVGLD